MNPQIQKTILLTIIISLLAYFFIYHTFIPLMIHENAHKFSHEQFTEGTCNITITRDTSYDDPLHEGYYSETNCDTEVYGAPFYITKIVGYGTEFVFAGTLFISPLSSFGGIWFSRLAKNFIYEPGYENYDLFFIDFRISIFLGLVSFILFLVSFWVQYKWIRYFLDRCIHKEN